MRYPSIILAASIALLTCLGCAGKQTSLPVTPSQLQTQTAPSDSHFLWGLWEFRANPAAGTLDAIPMRTSAMHVNVLPFLEPPAGLRLKISNLQFNGTICDVDVSLVHPFPGLDQYTGFDVAGVFISSGDVSGFQDPNLLMTGPGDTRLLNPDGFTRWWNPLEFSIPGQPIMRYRDGLMGTKYTSAGYNCTLNGYKLFADGLDSDADIHDLAPENRNTFSAGQSRTRHYTIDFAYGMNFNYAVDANWEPPTSGPPYTVDDFPELANRPEAWAISVSETENTLWNDGGGSGGNLSLLIDVWDHYHAGSNVVWADSPGNFSLVTTATPISGGSGYSTYEVDIVDATPHPGAINILIGIESETVGYWDVLPDDPITGYFGYTADVTGETPAIVVMSPNGGEAWDAKTQHDITWSAPPSVQFVDISYSKDDFVSDSHGIVADFPNTGLYQWMVPNDPSDTVKVKVQKSGGGIFDTSDDYFEIVKGQCNFTDSTFSVTQNYSVSGCWSHKGILVTKHDPVQRVIGQSWASEGNGGIIKVFNASDPMAGAVATYDTGDLIYCNNDQAMWMDAYSEPGIDRIAYVNFGSGSPTPGYQLKTIDWNGASFVNPQTLPKPSINGIWNACFTPDGDIITHDAMSISPTFWKYDKSEGYAASLLFVLQQSTCPFGTVSNIREIAYDPINSAILLICKNDSVSIGGQLFALSMTGQLLFQDSNVFGTLTAVRGGMGIDIDPASPDCRIVAYTGTDDGTAWFARFSADLAEKKVKPNPSFYYFYGVCRGDLQTDGTLWATPDTGTARFYKFAAPTDW